MSNDASVAAHFWDCVNKSDDPDACWEWGGVRDGAGYGRFRRYGAHRIAYELTIGLIPPGMVILHSCDNPPCCNPAHLQAGTQAANMQERVLKGRGGHKPQTQLRRYERAREHLEMIKQLAEGTHACPFCGFDKLSGQGLSMTRRRGSCWVCRAEYRMALWRADLNTALRG